MYASFDRFPSSKGAATHIDAFITALGREFGNVDLLTVAPESLQASQTLARSESEPGVMSLSDMYGRNVDTGYRAAGVKHHAIPAGGEHLFERVLNFRSCLWNWWSQRFGETTHRPPIYHFRSIFEGYPIAQRKHQFCSAIVYEVNGLPSIELKYRYPNVADDSLLIKKLRHQEQVCLDAADLVVTVSQVNANHLRDRGVSEQRLRVIPNGVDLAIYRAPDPWPSAGGFSGRPCRLLYSGTMSSWQGTSVAINAVALIRRDVDARLTLVGHAQPSQRRELSNLVTDRGLDGHVEILDPVSKSKLAQLHQDADFVVAPLTRNDRNTKQGCCPLKVLEGMASGTPLIASDLEVVRELATHGEHAFLVRPGSAKAIKDAVFELMSNQQLARRIADRGREHVKNRFQWRHAQESLIESYRDLMMQQSSIQ